MGAPAAGADRGVEGHCMKSVHYKLAARKLCTIRSTTAHPCHGIRLTGFEPIGSIMPRVLHRIGQRHLRRLMRSACRRVSSRCSKCTTLVLYRDGLPGGRTSPGTNDGGYGRWALVRAMKARGKTDAH